MQSGSGELLACNVISIHQIWQGVKTGCDKRAAVLLQNLHDAGHAVHAHALAIPHPASGLRNTGDGRDAVLPRDNGGVRDHAAQLGDHCAQPEGTAPSAA